MEISGVIERVGRIAEVRELPEGQAAISPARFPDWDSIEPIRERAR